MMYFPSTKNRLKLKKLDKNCIQSIISKENRRIVIFLRTRVWYFFGSFCFTETIISHWKLFFLVVSLSGEMVREKIVRQTKPGGVAANPGTSSQTKHFDDILLGSGMGCAGAGATCC